MAATAPIASLQPADGEQAISALQSARARTMALVAHLSDEQLQSVHSPIMSPLVWDLGHVAAYEDLWIAQRHAGLELLRGDLADAYDAFETPRSVRGEIELLGPGEARVYLDAVRARTERVLNDRGVGDGFVCEMVIRHELQHSETMRQTLAIAGLLPDGEPPLIAMDGEDGWLRIPAGAFAMGARPEGFAYDNERPRHELWADAFQIARRPVSNAAWMRFVERGGYERREWWSEHGWAWKAQREPGPHAEIPKADPQAPVCHVSWFEADAYARASDARLPTEAEWEKSATLSASDAGAGSGLAEVGRVWEWTRSSFGGYPGFVAHPYREYSEVFFGEGYRVLRGGSWATDARVASPTFRNWDLPERRQIFAGVRLARDLR
jgi:gamma-glutamyl hercynylcysteine S-oxide synthase